MYDFDFIICEGDLHYIVEIECCLRMLQGRMRPGAFLLAVEFEGPFRFQLSELQVRWINLALRLMPRPLRPVPRDDCGPFPAADAENLSILYAPPPPDAIAQFDPTEAYSGPALKWLLPQRFDVIERKGFGGILLSYMAAHFDFRRTNNDLFSRAWLKVLCEIENMLIATRILQDEFIYVLRRTNLAGWPDARA